MSEFRDWYDRAADIRDILSAEGFKGLEKIRKERAEARQRGETLHGFIIYQHWMISRDGHFGSFRTGFKYRQLLEMQSNLADVVDVSCLEEIFNKNIFIEMSMPAYSFPNADSICPECKKGWTLATAHDCKDQYKGEGNFDYYHKACWEVMIFRNEHKFFWEVFNAAGFESTPLVPIPNEYWGPNEMSAPWFLMKTIFGTIKIGWRKRVIQIDWEKTGFRDGEKLFESEDVTKSDTHIHAWGKDKAIEYLTKLRGELIKPILSLPA